MNWEGIVIHHSASGDVSANTIDQWHKEKGWKGVGYHFVIRANGDIEPARNWNAAGAHARGRNQNYIGICLTGNFTKHPPTAEQLAALIHLIKGVKSRWQANKIEKHHESCPGPMFPWDFFINAVS